MHPHGTALHYEIPFKSWEVVGADIFMVNNITLPCIEDYCSEFPVVKKAVGLSTDDLLHTTKTKVCRVWTT